jgi:glutamyl/glutaminyl-tRNA synthetase
VEQQLQAEKANRTASCSAFLKEQREALEKANAEAINAEKAKVFAEKLKVEEQPGGHPAAAAKTFEELGEGAEIDLFEDLKSEFPDDKISRVGKGAPAQTSSIGSSITGGIVDASS